MSAIAASAQQFVTGVVLDDAGQPLAGANVLSQDGTLFTTTDAHGRFEIKAMPGESLKVWFMGYREFILKVSAGMPEAVITLVPDYEVLDDVVVVGYGAVKKSDLTGSVGHDLKFHRRSSSGARRRSSGA